MRPFTVQRHFIKHNPGSVLISFGDTKVICSATIENSVPRFLRDSGKGWLTSEYSLLPSSTFPRAQREAQRGKVTGRTTEIQRLIGRSLRAVVDMKKLGERQVVLDCDVLVADGGTRTTSISGAFVALEMAIQGLLDKKLITESPIKERMGALSVGIDRDGKIIADLNYEEDSTCEADVNIVMTESGKFIEVQGTAEGEPFSREQLDAVLECGKTALESVFVKQKTALDS